MVMVVADPVLEASRRSGGLNAPEQAFGHQHAERVVHRLEGDRANLRSDDVGDTLRGDVGLSGDRSQHRQALRGDLNAALTKESGRVDGQALTVDRILELFKGWRRPCHGVAPQSFAALCFRVLCFAASTATITTAKPPTPVPDCTQKGSSL